MDFKCDNLDVVMLLKKKCCVNLWPHFGKATFEIKLTQI
jgi:hypothetical protein